MKRNEETVHISPAAVESVPRPLSGSIQPVRVSPTPTMANIIAGDLRTAANQLQVIKIVMFSSSDVSFLVLFCVGTFHSSQYDNFQ